MTKIKKIILVAGVVFAVAALFFQKAANFVKKGLADSQKIKVAESPNCAVAQEEPNFPGCNSIL